MKGDPTHATEYGYDPLDRLIGVKYPDGTATLYRLDPVGNRTGERKTLASKVVALTVAAFAAVSPADASSDLTNTFNRADWLTLQTDAVDASRNATLAYDLAGNLTTKAKASGTRTLAWDARGALASVSESGTELGRYDFDATGMRVKRSTASETVEYVLDDGHVLQEADGATSGHPSTRRYHYGYGPLSVTDNLGKRFIQTDALGSPTDLTSTSGAIASMRKYDAWGSYRDATAPTSADEKLGYTGHQYDPETGLVYARARYYDPEVGAFISRDSFEGWLEDAPSLHRYQYAYGNPLTYVDPDGNAAADAADAWQKKQEEVAWTAEQVMAQAGGNSEEIGRETADEFYRNHGNNEFMRFLVGLKVTFVQTVHEVSGAISGTIVDPTILVRAPLRLGTTFAAGAEKIQEGKYAEGALLMVADTAGAVGTAGGMWGATAPIRAAASGPSISLGRRASAAAEGEAAVGRGGAATVARTAEVEVGASRARPASQEAPAVSRAPQVSAAMDDLLDVAMRDGQARSQGIASRLAERAANDPQFLVAMERGPRGAPPQGVGPTVGELRRMGQADAHHVIQDAAVRDLAGYETNAAPGVRLDGPARQVGTPHYEATQAQRLPGGGTYGAERRIGYRALREAGYSEAEARAAMARADRYFEGIGVDRTTHTRIPGNRRRNRR